MDIQKLLEEKREEILRICAKYGARNVRVFGSVARGEADDTSDIDLLVHTRGSDEQRQSLLNWMEGWGRCLSELNYLRTGYRTENLLDVHLVTDADIENKTSYAAKIDAVTDAARELRLGIDDLSGE